MLNKICLLMMCITATVYGSEPATTHDDLKADVEYLKNQIQALQERMVNWRCPNCGQGIVDQASDGSKTQEVNTQAADTVPTT